MTPTAGNPARPLGDGSSRGNLSTELLRERAILGVLGECDAWALCCDVLDLDWTAITPCPGCVRTAVADGSGTVGIAGPPTALRARPVTADVLEELLLAARQARGNGRSS